MSLVRINKNPSRKELTIFGISWAIFFGFVGWLVLRRFESMPAATALWVFAGAVPAIGFLVPAVMKAAFLAISYITWPIGFVLSTVVLCMVYYLILTPLALVMRLFGYDPMTKRLAPDESTYWQAREPAGKADSYFKQY